MYMLCKLYLSKSLYRKMHLLSKLYLSKSLDSKMHLLSKLYLSIPSNRGVNDINRSIRVVM